MSKSVGVRIAEIVSKNMNINDTIWFSDLVTLADEIDSELEESKKQGALEEIKLLRYNLNGLWETEVFEREVIEKLEKIYNKRIKELEEAKEQ